MARLLRPIQAIALLGGVLVATLAAQQRLSAALPAESGSEALLPRPGLARVVALGFENLLADYYWLRVVQVVGRETTNPARHASLIGRYSEIVTALDPWVDHPYRFAVLWMSEDPSETRAANRIMERGVAYHPADWRNRFYLSFNHLFHLGDAEAAARELEGAVGREGAPPYLARLLARLRSAGGDLDAAESYLRALLGDGVDGWHKIDYERALVEIGTERRARVLDEARARFRTENGFDIARVEDLAWGPHAVLWTLPPEPNGAGWELDPASGRIVSGHYRRRYEVNFQDPAQKLESPSPDEDAGGAQG